MNSSIYIFGNMQQGYTQYPDDETTHEIFQNFALNAKAPTQLAIHRDGSLIYYGYIRKLIGEQYIGLCILLNGHMVNDMTALFTLFERTMEHLAEQGYLIKFDTDGSLIANTDHLYMSKTEVESVSSRLQQEFESLDGCITTQPPVNYTQRPDSVGTFNFSDDALKIVESTHNNGYTYVYKRKGFNTATMDSYKGVLEAMNTENEALKRQVEQMKAERISTPTTVNPKAKASGDSNILRNLVIFFVIIALGLLIGYVSYQNVHTSDKVEYDFVDNTNDECANAYQQQTQERLTDLETQQQHTERNVQAPSRESTVHENQSTGVPATASLLRGYVKDEDGYTNVRQGPGTNYEIVTTIKDGSLIYYTVYNSKWNIVYDNYGNALGYMYHNRIVQSNQTQNNTANNNQGNNDGYVTALSTRKLNVGDIDGLTNTDLTILRNMIYARHGYRFKRDDLFLYFSQFSWYHPTTSDMTTISAQLSDIEQYNVNFIRSIEQ